MKYRPSACCSKAPMPTAIDVRPIEPGTPVRITDGPLKGRAGELITYTNANQAILRIEALGTEIHATLTPAQLEALQAL